MDTPTPEAVAALQETLNAEISTRNSERYTKAVAFDPTAFSSLSVELKSVLEAYPGDPLKIREEYNKKINAIYSTIQK